jgi:NAD(P)-dependent dehydrogenase (short-subunit alcohol dehydrogenase family)
MSAPQPRPLAGKTAIVTGSNSGIGAAAARGAPRAALRKR